MDDFLQSPGWRFGFAAVQPSKLADYNGLQRALAAGCGLLADVRISPKRKARPRVSPSHACVARFTQGSDLFCRLTHAVFPPRVHLAAVPVSTCRVAPCQPTANHSFSDFVIVMILLGYMLPCMMCATIDCWHQSHHAAVHDCWHQSHQCCRA